MLQLLNLDLYALRSNEISSIPIFKIIPDRYRGGKSKSIYRVAQKVYGKYTISTQPFKIQ